MKQTITTLLIVGAILTLFAFKSLENKSMGAIGDLKYSVLPPDKFKEENGSGWVLMDDKIPLATSDINSKHGITELPDARGMFIRGLNLTRNDDKADKFFTENKRQRLMGEFQSDDIIKHDHSTGEYWSTNNYYAQGGTGGGYRMEYKNSGTGKTGGEETRPKNLAFYIYVKINE